jgi:carboxymethylenebutenolidase
MGQDIGVSYNGGELPAYFAAPSSGNGIGVVIVTAIFGVDDDTKKICDDLATAGYPTIAPNMFWLDENSGVIAVSPEGSEQGKARAGRVERDDGNAYIGACIDELKAHENCNGKVAVMGFCFGGPYVVQAAARFDVAGGISFHGSFVEKFLGELVDVSCPLAFHYGDNDEVAPMAAIDQIQAACEKRENAEVFVYSGGQHGYMFPNRGAGYLHDAAQLSWDRAFEFLNKL